MHIQAWNLYFPEEEYTVFNDVINLIKDLKQKIRPLLDYDSVLSTQSFEVKMSDLERWISEDFLNKNGDSVLKSVSCAVSELLYDEGHHNVEIKTFIIPKNKNYTFESLEPSNVNKIVFLTGIVCRVGHKKISINRAFFECSKCKNILTVSINNNMHKQPTKCNGSCKSKSFVFLPNHREMKCRDVQDIKVQEIFYNESTSMPFVIECVIYDGFVGALAPGDVVQLVGVLHAQTENDVLYKLVIAVNNVQHVNNKNFYLEDTGCLEEDFKLFRSIAKTPNLISILINSFYATIYGNELIKAGLVLALFGGTQKFAGEGRVRSEVHVLIVGDPGLGKSRMLQSSCQILPKSSYVSGNFTTTAGLTVAITHDPVSGEYMVDAGALVISDCGICCLDEFDKIDDHSSLFEAMEDQRVTVAKGGVVCSVPTRTTIIAAANPKHGHFNSSKNIRENLKFDSALLSRFDLIFILVDNLTEQENYDISDQILKRRLVYGSNRGHESNDAKADDSLPEDKGTALSEHRISAKGSHKCLSNSTSLDVNTRRATYENAAEGKQLRGILHNLREDKFVQRLRNSDKVFSMDILKKYISYAKNSVFPTLSVGAKDMIKRFYLSIRDSENVTTRDLESLIRLAEARAKIELRSIATHKDAEFVIELYKRVNIIERKEKKKLSIKELMERIKDIVKVEKKDTVTSDEIKVLVEKYNTDKSLAEVIELLNYKGMLIKKGKNKYKFVN